MKLPRPLVSVIISNYNYGRFLPDCIDSVRAQTYDNLEIIVVDDGSTDDSRSVLEGYAGVKAIFKENGGQASAINRGVAESTGEILCFLDSDDGWYPTKVERVVSVLRQNAEWCRHKARMVDEQLNQLSCVMPDFRGSGVIPTATVFFTERIVSAQPTCLAMTRAVADETFPVEITPQLAYDADDAVMLAKVFATGKRGYSIDEVLAFYRRHPAERFGAHDIPKLLRREADVTAALPQVFGSTVVPSAAYKLRAVIAALEGASITDRRRWGAFGAGLGRTLSLFRHPRLMGRQAVALTVAFAAPRLWLRKLSRAANWPPVS